MLVFVLTHPSKPDVEISNHVGDKLDYAMVEKWEDDGYTCTLVQADGDELMWIFRTFQNLPTTDQFVKSVQKWRGPFAQFIFDNTPRFFIGKGSA